MHTFQLSLNSVLEMTDRALLARLGIDQLALTSIDQSKCQLVGGAVERLTHDGLIVPSARSSANNLVIFVNRCPLDACLDLIETEIIAAYKAPN